MKQTAIIGGGMIARSPSTISRKIDAHGVRWRVEIDDRRRADRVGPFNIPESSAESQDALNDDAVDAVVLCTRPFDWGVRDSSFHPGMRGEPEPDRLTGAFRRNELARTRPAAARCRSNGNCRI